GSVALIDTRPARAYAGIVDHDVQAAPAADFRDQFTHLHFASEVAGKEGRLTAACRDFCLDRRTLLAIAARDADAGTFLREMVDDAAPDAGIAAGHQYDLVLEAHVSTCGLRRLRPCGRSEPS